MFIRPARASKIGTVLVGTVTFAASALLLAFSPYEATAAGDDPPTILTKMIATYTNAKTYTASVVSKEMGKTPDGKQVGRISTQEIRYKAPNLVYAVMKQVGTGAAAGKKPDGTPIIDSGKIIVNSDGKVITIYSETRNQYVKQTAQPSIPLTEVFALLKSIPPPKTPGLFMGTPTTVGGRSAYVVALKPTMPPNLSAADQKKWQEGAKDAQPLRIIVDKQNYQLLGINESAKAGSLDISFNSQSVNGALPANAFSYKPPAGSKEAPKTQPQPGGGVPGLHP